MRMCVACGKPLSNGTRPDVSRHNKTNLNVGKVQPGRPLRRTCVKRCQLLLIWHVGMSWMANKQVMSVTVRIASVRRCPHDTHTHMHTNNSQTRKHARKPPEHTRNTTTEAKASKRAQAKTKTGAHTSTTRTHTHTHTNTQACRHAGTDGNTSKHTHTHTHTQPNTRAQAHK